MNRQEVSLIAASDWQVCSVAWKATFWHPRCCCWSSDHQDSHGPSREEGLVPLVPPVYPEPSTASNSLSVKQKHNGERASQTSTVNWRASPSLQLSEVLPLFSLHYFLVPSLTSGILLFTSHRAIIFSDSQLSDLPLSKPNSFKDSYNIKHTHNDPLETVAKQVVTIPTRLVLPRNSSWLLTSLIDWLYETFPTNF